MGISGDIQEEVKEDWVVNIIQIIVSIYGILKNKEKTISKISYKIKIQSYLKYLRK